MLKSEPLILTISIEDQQAWRLNVGLPKLLCKIHGLVYCKAAIRCAANSKRISLVLDWPGVWEEFPVRWLNADLQE